ncbi:MAG: S9 family peptidase [Chloroflexi bacterium]|nr:S9 family peptidase [Chloroflexota bacterium]
MEQDIEPGIEPGAVEAQEARPLTLEDFWRLRSVSDVQLSPDGSAVAYVVDTYDEKRNAAHSAIWLASLSDGRARRFTGGETADTQPRWSPDGRRLAFVSTRHEGKPQIFVIDRDGGESRRVTGAEHGALSPVWSPDGTQLCYTAAIPSDRQSVPRERAWLEAHPEATDGGAQLRRQSSLLSRFDGRGYIDRRMHLFLISAADPDGEARQLTDGDYDDVEAAWSPDGGHIAFLSHRGEEQEHRLATDIWTIDVASGELRRLTSGDLMAGGPSWSPDGRHIAFYASPSWSIAGYRDAHLWIVSREGDQRDISARKDLGHRHVQPDYMFPTPTPPAWSPDGRIVYFTLIERGDDAVYAVDLGSGGVRRLSEPGTDVMAIQCSSDGQNLVLLACSPGHPFDVFMMPAAGGAPQPVVSTNGDLLASVALVAPRRLTWTGPRGWEIEGWLYAPEGVDSPPLVLHVHGGPYGAWGSSFYFQAQVLAGQGYASLYVNPRGSLGYGQEFSAAADWGEDDFRDLMAGIDAVLERGAADPRRLGITGISYGGFMTNWALGHTDRFRAGVSVNGVSNQVSMFGVGDMSALWLPHEFGGAFWESGEAWERYRRHSPIAYVDRTHTPLLLIQSENDYRCPIEQGEQMLTALRARRQVVELIRFPGASHVVAASGTPLQRYLQWRLALDWFDTYLKPDRQPATTADEEGGVTVSEPPTGGDGC